MNMKNKDYKQSKRYKQITERVEQNIKLIYENQEIDKFIKNIDENLDVSYFYETVFNGVNPFDFNHYLYYDEKSEEKEATIEPAQNMDSVIERMLDHNLGNELMGYPEEFPKIRKILKNINSFDENSEIMKICTQTKVSPRIFRDVIKAKLVGVSLNDLLDNKDWIIENYYLPKPLIKNGELTIKINELTTINDLKMVWSKIEEKQIKIGAGYKSQVRKYSNIDRDRRACELKNEGKKWKDIIKMLQKEGYKCTDPYSDASQMKRVRKKRKLEI